MGDLAKPRKGEELVLKNFCKKIYPFFKFFKTISI